MTDNVIIFHELNPEFWSFVTSYRDKVFWHFLYGICRYYFSVNRSFITDYVIIDLADYHSIITFLFERRRERPAARVSDQVLHKPGETNTEDG